jgi:hypothetical protein
VSSITKRLHCDPQVHDSLQIIMSAADN